MFEYLSGPIAEALAANDEIQSSLVLKLARPIAEKSAIVVTKEDAYQLAFRQYCRAAALAANDVDEPVEPLEAAAVQGQLPDDTDLSEAATAMQKSVAELGNSLAPLRVYDDLRSALKTMQNGQGSLATAEEAVALAERAFAEAKLRHTGIGLAEQSLLQAQAIDAPDSHKVLKDFCLEMARSVLCCHIRPVTANLQLLRLVRALHTDIQGLTAIATTTVNQ